MGPHRALEPDHCVNQWRKDFGPPGLVAPPTRLHGLANPASAFTVEPVPFEFSSEQLFNFNLHRIVGSPLLRRLRQLEQSGCQFSRGQHAPLARDLLTARRRCALKGSCAAFVPSTAKSIRLPVLHAAFASSGVSEPINASSRARAASASAPFCLMAASSCAGVRVSLTLSFRGLTAFKS